MPNCSLTINHNDENLSPKQLRRHAYIELREAGEQPIPKDLEELQTTDSILGELEYPMQTYPFLAVEQCKISREKMTPALIDILKEAIENHHQEHENYLAPVFALYLLSEFGEQNAFPTIIELVKIEEENLSMLIGGCIEDMCRFFASTFNGDINLIKDLVEDESLSSWIKFEALKSMLVLFKQQKLSRDDIIPYFKGLYSHPAYTSNDLAMAFLIDVSNKLYPKELYPEIKHAFDKGLVDICWIDIDDVDSNLTETKEDIIEREIIDNEELSVIEDTHMEMQEWAYADEDEDEDEDEEFSIEYALDRTHMELATALLTRFFDEGFKEEEEDNVSFNKDGRPSGSQDFNFIRDLLEVAIPDMYPNKATPSLALDDEKMVFEEISNILKRGAEKNEKLFEIFDLDEMQNIGYDLETFYDQLAKTFYMFMEIAEANENDDDHDHRFCNHDHGHHHHTIQPITRLEPKIGRNDPCMCGSGKKLKKCCGA